MRLFRTLLAGVSLLLIPLSFLTKFTVFGIPSTVLLVLVIPVLAVLYSQTTKKDVFRTPSETALLLQRFTCHEDLRWKTPNNEKSLLTEFESAIFKTNLLQGLDDILAPLVIRKMLSLELFTYRCLSIYNVQSHI